MLSDAAIRDRARRIVNEDIDAPQIVRNAFLPTAYRWLKFMETWPFVRPEPGPSSPALGDARAESAR